MEERYNLVETYEDVRRVLDSALGTARGFGRDTATEHVFIALASEKEGVASRVLTKFGIKAHALYNAVFSLTKRGDIPMSKVKDLTPSVHSIVKFAVNEALRMGHDDVNTGHLLLGVVHESEGVTATALASLGVSLEQIHTQTLQALDELYAPPALPLEAISLVAEDERALICGWCNAHCPSYFRYCFNCGQLLVHKSSSEKR